MKSLTIILFLLFAFIGANGAIRTWDGSGGDANLATAANWVDDITPVENDDLVFPSGVLSPTFNNNLTSTTVIRSISLDGNNYTFNGNAFNITNGITVSNSSQNFGDGVIFNSAVNLIGISQTFTNSLFGSVIYSQISMGSTNLTISGVGSNIITNISGNGLITKEGNVRCTINGGVNFGGSYLINAGTLNINANTPSSNVVNNGGILGGSGLVGKVTNNSGTINLTGGTLIFLSFSTNDSILDTGDLILSGTSTYLLSIMTNFIGVTSNSQLNVSGTVTLNNPLISRNGFSGGSIPINLPFTIINNDGTDAVTGIFNGLPEGSNYFVRGILYKISYIGGTGNDVTLTRLNVAPFDFDGDGKTDIAIYKPANGLWSIKQSGNNVTKNQQFGLSPDLITPADFDGDFKTDIAVFRPSTGVWYRLNSIDNSFFATQFGLDGDIPVPGDYQGVGKSDIGVFRQGIWYLNNVLFNTIRIDRFGLSSDKPMPRDYNGDGRVDIGVFRPSTGFWYYSSPFFVTSFGNPPVNFGISTDTLIPADYDGDGRADYAVFRPSNVGGEADFYILQSSNNAVRYVEWGSVGDIPQTGDFDGDGKIDIAIYRPTNSSWHLLQSTAGYSSTIFGQTGDKPVSSAYIN